jgi:hypothetical protein
MKFIWKGRGEDEVILLKNCLEKIKDLDEV